MEEMDLAAKLQKITKMDPQALGAKAVVEMATIEGARALHMDKEIGSLEVGKKADLILIGLDAPECRADVRSVCPIGLCLEGAAT